MGHKTFCETTPALMETVMSKRHRKTRMFDDVVLDMDFVDFEAPKGKRPKGKDWGKARRSNKKAAYWDA